MGQGCEAGSLRPPPWSPPQKMEVQRLLKSRRKELQWEPGPGAPPARPGGQAGEELAPRPRGLRLFLQHPDQGKEGPAGEGPEHRPGRQQEAGPAGGLRPREEPESRTGEAWWGKGPRARSRRERRPLPRSPPPGGADAAVGSLSPHL